MDNKEKVQGLNIVMNGITINGPMFDIHDNHNIVINAASPTPSKEEGHTQEGVAKRDTLEKALSFEDVLKAAEECQSYFWAQSSWAVVYCVCRDHLKMMMSMSEFERRVANYPLKPSTYLCTSGTVQKALDNNDYMRYPISQWAKHGAKERVTLLVAELGEKLK